MGNLDSVIDEVFGAKSTLKKEQGSGGLDSVVDEVFGAQAAPAPPQTSVNRPMTKAEQMVWDRAMMPQRALQQAEMMQNAPRVDQIEAQDQADIQNLIESGQAQLTDTQVERGQKLPADSYLDVFKKPVKNLPGRFVETAGDALRFYSETMGSDSPVGKYLSREKIPQKIVDFAKDRMIDEIEPGDSQVKKYLGMATESVAQMSPWMTAGAMLGKPWVVLAGMGTQQGLEKYGELREEGVPVGPAMGGAMIHGGAEVVGELGPTRELLKHGLPILKKGASFLVKDLGGEEFTYVMQFMNDKGLLKPDMGWKEFWEGFRDTAIVTGIASPMQFGAIEPVVRFSEKLADIQSKKVIKEYASRQAMAATMPPKFNWPDQAAPTASGSIVDEVLGKEEAAPAPPGATVEAAPTAQATAEEPQSSPPVAAIKEEAQAAGIPETTVTEEGREVPTTFFHARTEPIEEWKPGQKTSFWSTPLTEDFGDHVYEVKLNLKNPAPDIDTYRMNPKAYDGIIYESKDYQGNPGWMAITTDPSVFEEVKYHPPKEAAPEVVEEGAKAKEPWEMTVDEFKTNPPEGFVFDPGLKYEADAQTGVIRVGPKFFELPVEGRASVVRHERSHGFEDRSVRDPEFYRLVQEDKMFGPVDENGTITRGINGQYKPGENLVEAYNVLFEDPGWLKKNYPIAYDYVIKEAKRQGRQLPEDVIAQSQSTTQSEPPIHDQFGMEEPPTEEPQVGTPEYFEQRDQEGATGRPEPKYATTDDYSKDIRPDEAEQAAYTPHDALSSIVGMPEMIWFMKLLSGGKVPKINRLMRRKGGSRTLGHFDWKKMEIHMATGAFENPAMARMVLAHEMGHWIDFLGGEYPTMVRGNILGHLAALSRYAKEVIAPFPGAPGELTDADRAALRREAARQAKEGQKAKKKEVTEADIIAIWNSLEKANPELERYIAALSGAQKAELVRAAMKGAGLPEWFDFQAGADNSEDVSRIYAELLRAEMEKRNLFGRDEILEELKGISKTWRPFNETADQGYTNYRYSLAELYADFVSVLFNRPRMLQEKAPRAWEMWHNYLQNRPEVSRLWAELQMRLSQSEEANQDFRLNEAENIWQEGNARLMKALQRKPGSWNAAIDQFQRAMNTERAPWIKMGKAVEKRHLVLAANDNIRFITEELPYSDATIHLYFIEVIDKVYKPYIVKKGHSIKDLDIYAQLWNNATQSARQPSPGGFDLDASSKMLQRLKQKWGPEKYGDIQAAFSTWQQLRQEDVMPHVKHSEAWSDDLTAYMIGNLNYVRRIVLDKMMNKFGEADLRTVFSGKVYERVGSFKDVAPSFQATLIQDVAMLYASHVNQIKRESIEWLFKFNNDPNVIRPLEYQKFGKRPSRVIKENPYKGFTAVKYVYKGRLTGAYVADNLAAFMNREPEDFNMLRLGWSKLSNPIKELMVSHNPGWNIWNIQRDFRESILKLPGATAAKLAVHYPSAFKEAFNEVWRGKTSSDLKEMHAEKSLVPQSVWQADYQKQGNYLEAVMVEMAGDMKNRLRDQPFYRMPDKLLRVLWDALGKIGQTVERASKLAAHKYLKQNFPAMPVRERSHLVRTRAGSPNAFERGSANWLYNEVFPFSNMGKEGYRSNYEAFAENPQQYAWKFIKWNVIPKMVIWTGMIGAMSMIMDWLEDYFKPIPDRDLANYFVWPGWKTEDGKVVYFLFPKDFTAQAILGALAITFMPLIRRDEEGVISSPTEIMKYLVGGLPYTNFHPILNVVRLAINTAQGQNTQDLWTGRGMITDDSVFTDKGLDMWTEAGRAAWNQVFSSIYRFRSRNEKELTNELEKLYRLPVVGAFLSRFVRVSDQGIADHIKRNVTDRHEAEAQPENRAVRAKINEHLDDTKLYFSNFASARESDVIEAHAKILFQQLRQEGLVVHKTWEGFWSTYKSLSIQKSGSVAAKELNRGSKELKMKKLEYMNQNFKEYLHR